MKSAARKIPVLLPLLLAAGVFLSTLGEFGGNSYPGLPRVPDIRTLDNRVVRAQMLGAVLFGGFRGIVVDLTWIYMEHLWYHARFYHLPALYEFITAVEPQWIDGWVMGGWHMAFNMAAAIPHEEGLTPGLYRKRELEWIIRGISFLKAGAALNPETYQIHFEIGWTYYMKLKDPREAVPWMEKAAKCEDAPAFVPRMLAIILEASGRKEDSLAAWRELRQHPSYEQSTIRNIVERHIERLTGELAVS